MPRKARQTVQIVPGQTAQNARRATRSSGNVVAAQNNAAPPSRRSNGRTERKKVPLHDTSYARAASGSTTHTSESESPEIQEDANVAGSAQPVRCFDETLRDQSSIHAVPDSNQKNVLTAIKVPPKPPSLPSEPEPVASNASPATATEVAESPIVSTDGNNVDTHQKSTIEQLRKEVEYLKAENAEKKKLIAIVEKQATLYQAIMQRKSEDDIDFIASSEAVKRDVENEFSGSERDEQTKKTIEIECGIRQRALMFNFLKERKKAQIEAVRQLTSEVLEKHLNVILGAHFVEEWKEPLALAKLTEMETPIGESDAFHLVKKAIEAGQDINKPYISVENEFPALVFALVDANILEFHPSEPTKVRLACVLPTRRIRI